MFAERFPGQLNWQEAGQQRVESCSHLISPGCMTRHRPETQPCRRCQAKARPVAAPSSVRVLELNQSLSPRVVWRACSDVLLLSVCCLTPLHSAAMLTHRAFGVLGRRCTDLVSSSTDDAGPQGTHIPFKWPLCSPGESHFWASPTCYPLACRWMLQTLTPDVSGIPWWAGSRKSCCSKWFW